MSLLQTVRTVASRATLNAPVIGVVLPVPGDVRGLPAGTQFERDALTAGEAVIVTDPRDPATAIGLVPEFEYDEDVDEAEIPELHRLSWTVYSLPGVPVLDHHDLGEAEHALLSAVRSAADALTAIGLGSTGAGVDDPRGLVEQLLESGRHHQIPDHAPSRAVRVLEKAAHVDAIISVSAGLSRLDDAPGPMGRLAAGPAGIEMQSSSQAQIATDALRPLAPVVRCAQMAAVSAILRSAWID